MVQRRSDLLGAGLDAVFPLSPWHPSEWSRPDYAGIRIVGANPKSSSGGSVAPLAPTSSPARWTRWRRPVGHGAGEDWQGSRRDSRGGRFPDFEEHEDAKALPAPGGLRSCTPTCDFGIRCPDWPEIDGDQKDRAVVAGRQVHGLVRTLSLDACAPVDDDDALSPGALGRFCRGYVSEAMAALLSSAAPDCQRRAALPRKSGYQLLVAAAWAWGARMEHSPVRSR